MTTKVAAAVLLLAATVAAPGQAQEVEAFYLASQADHPEFPDPGGLGFALRTDVTDRLAMRWSFTSYDTGVRMARRVCIHHSPEWNCAVENTTSDATLRGIHVTGILRLLGEAPVELNGGLGFSVNNLRHQVESTDSDRSTDLVEPTGGQVGALLRLEGRLAPEGLPVYVMAGLQNHWVKFTGCLEGAEPAEAPFCGGTNLRDLQLGVGLRF